MKKVFTGMLFLCAGPLLAGTAGINMGSGMTMGPSSTVHSIQSATNNPAMNSLLVADDEAWRLSYFPGFGFNTEIGDVENFADDINELIDLVEDSAATQDTVSEVLDKFNSTLETMGETGYLKSTAGFGLPIPALVHRSDRFGGSFGVDAGVQAQVSLRVLDSGLTFDAQNESFSTASSLYLKSGIEKAVSFSYSRPFKITGVTGQLDGQPKLYAGISARVISLSLSKQVLPLQELGGRDVDTVISDQYDNNLNESTNISLDAGVVWDAGNYRLGLTLENINSPSFDYGEIGSDCDSRQGAVARSSCEAAALFIQQRGEITARETHRMHARARVDGLYHLNKQWLASVSLDLARYNDFVGYENQWINIATAYEFKNNFVPSLRAGLQKNFAGEKLSSLTLGLNFFKYFSLDVELGLDKTTVESASAPRRFGVALGVEERF